MKRPLMYATPVYDTQRNKATAADTAFVTAELIL